MESVGDFLKNKEENIFGISINYKDEKCMGFILDDFEFKLTVENCLLSTEEDILIPICEKVNRMEFKTQLDVLLEFSKLYGEEMGEEKPLYEGQDLFEDENDNNDIKFEGRLRLTEESFPSELFVHVLKFLEPSFVCKLSRVSKKWLKLTQLDVLWKDFCKKEGTIQLSEGNSSYIDEYKDLLYYGLPKEISFPESMMELVKESQKEKFTISLYHGSHIYMQIIDSSNAIPNQLNFHFGFVTLDEIQNVVSLDQPPRFSVSWNGGQAVIFDEGKVHDLDYVVITTQDGDIVGADYNKKTGEFRFIHNDTDLGIVYKATKGLDLCIMVQIKNRFKLVRGKKTTKKLEGKKILSDLSYKEI